MTHAFQCSSLRYNTFRSCDKDSYFCLYVLKHMEPPPSAGAGADAEVVRRLGSVALKDDADTAHAGFQGPIALECFLVCLFPPFLARLPTCIELRPLNMFLGQGTPRMVYLYRPVCASAGPSYAAELSCETHCAGTAQGFRELFKGVKSRVWQCIRVDTSEQVVLKASQHHASRALGFSQQPPEVRKRAQGAPYPGEGPEPAPSAPGALCACGEHNV